MTEELHRIEAGLAQRVKGLLKTFDAAELEAILSIESGIDALNAARAIEATIARRGSSQFAGAEGAAGWMALLHRLIDAGVSLEQPVTGPAPLAYAIHAGLKPSEKLAVVRALLAAGADPHARAAVGVSAFDAAQHPRVPRAVRELLEEYPSDPRWAAEQLVDRLRRGWSWSKLASLSSLVPDLDATTTSGLAPIHAAALSASVDLVREILSRVSNPNTLTAGEGSVEVGPKRACWCYIHYVPGMTAMDLLDVASRSLEQETANTGRVDLVAACQAELRSAGATRTTNTAPPTPQRSIPSRYYLETESLLDTGHVIVGRRVGSWASAWQAKDELAGICDSVDIYAARAHLPIVARAVGDDLVVGLQLADLDEEYLPVPVSRDAMLAAIDQAETLPWNEIQRLVTRRTADAASAAPAWQRSAVYPVPLGLVAGVCVMYGVRVGEEDPDPEESLGWSEEDVFAARYVTCPDGPGHRVPGLELYLPQTPGIYMPSLGVYGTQVDFVHVGDLALEATAVDLSIQAHQQRQASLGTLADQATYHFVLHYD